MQRLAALRGALAIALIACSGARSPGPEDGGGPGDAGPPLPSLCRFREGPRGSAGWEVFCGDAPVGHLLGVWGSSDRDVYFVGGLGTTTILHWDGERLEKMDNPGRARAWWVFGTDADHVWVVGEKGLGLRRVNRGAWEPFDTGTRQTIFGLWGEREDDLFYVTGDLGAGGSAPEVFRLGPTGPVKQDVPAGGARAFFKVWGTGASDVFVCGDAGTIVRFDGRRWSPMATPGSERLLTLFGLASREVYAVGGTTRAVLWRYDGEAWRDLQPPEGTPALMGVWGAADSPLLVSGMSGFVARRSGETLTGETRVTHDDLHAIWGTESHVWAVGGNLFSAEAARGVVLRRPRPRTDGPPPCPPGGIRGAGIHHLDLQGRQGTPNPDGTYPMFDVTRGTIDPRLVHGEHYLLGRGDFVEFSVPLCDDITDRVSFRIPNNDESGSVVLHQLFVVRDGREALVAEAVDDEAGNSGYHPFDRSNAPASELAAIAATDTSGRATGERGWSDMAGAAPFASPPADLLAGPGDTLLLRTTNLADAMFSIMVWFPQSGLKYQAFIEVEVPATPGGAPISAGAVPPEPGPCEPTTPQRFLELGRGDAAFEPFGPDPRAPVLVGPQGSLMFLLSVRGRGFDGGDPDDALATGNPWTLATLSLDAFAPGGRTVAEVRSRQGWEASGDDLVLLGLRPTVPTTYGLDQLVGQRIHAVVTIVDSTGLTLCHRATFVAERG